MDDAPITTGGIPVPPHPEHTGDTAAPAPPWAHWAPPPTPVEGRAPASPGRRWPKVAAAVGVAAGTAVGAAVLAAAATGPGGPDVTTAASSGAGTTSPPGSGTQAPGSSSGAGTQAPGMPDGPRHMFFGGPGMPGRILHGQFTVNGPNGYETLEVQNGTVSSITNTSGSTWSLVVTSADGTAVTYVVDSGTSVDGGETGVSSIASGDTVRVMAVVSGSTATAKQVADQTVMQKNGESWRPSPPAPSSSGTGSSPA